MFLSLHWVIGKPEAYFKQNVKGTMCVYTVCVHVCCVHTCGTEMLAQWL